MHGSLCNLTNDVMFSNFDLVLSRHFLFNFMIKVINADYGKFRKYRKENQGVASENILKLMTDG